MDKEEFILNVYLVDSCFEFCIDGKSVKLKDIMSLLKGDSSLAIDDCLHSKENPLYTFKIIKNSKSGASGFGIELVLTMINNEYIKHSPYNSKKIEESTESKNDYFIIDNYNYKKPATCSNIMQLLLIEFGLIGSSIHIVDPTTSEMRDKDVSDKLKDVFGDKSLERER